MSEPKRGEHYEACLIVFPHCLCNTCQKDHNFEGKYGCCAEKHPTKNCPIQNCKHYIADEPTKKGAEAADD